MYPNLKTKLKNDLLNNKFSLIVDESTDISVKKQLAIVIKYFSKSSLILKTTFLKLVQLSQGDAESIVNAILDVIEEFGLSIKNMIGLGTDNANVMVGATGGVIKKLQDLNPSIILIPCVCHSLQLSVSHAAATHLPRHIEFLISETYNWFSRSTTRRDNYEKLYKIINDGHDPLKVVQSSNTRWLSIETAVKRIIDQWLELELHFGIVKNSEKCFIAEQLYQIYKDKSNLCYLYFLHSVLEPVQKVNKLFESNNADCTKLLGDLLMLIHSLSNKIVPPRPDFDPLISNIIDYVMPSPYLGYRFEEEIKRLKIGQFSNQDENILRKRCIHFLISLIVELRSRLPKNIRILKKLDQLSMLNATKTQKKSIIPLIKEFGYSDHEIEKIEFQWNNLSYCKNNKNSDTITFWIDIFNYKDASGENPFFELSVFAINILTLPISNAEVERVFSSMNLIKNKQRNRFENAMLNSIIFLKSQMKSDSKCCATFDISDDIIKNAGNSSKYNFAIPQRELDEIDQINFDNIEY